MLKEVFGGQADLAVHNLKVRLFHLHTFLKCIQLILCRIVSRCYWRWLQGLLRHWFIYCGLLLYFAAYVTWFLMTLYSGRLLARTLSSVDQHLLLLLSWRLKYLLIIIIIRADLVSSVCAAGMLMLMINYCLATATWVILLNNRAAGIAILIRIC